MKLKSLFSALLLGCAMMAQAQSANDPTIMTINGQPISRSEFEYSYNKNNSEGVIDKKSVEEYVDLFINYKLKVQAAIDFVRSAPNRTALITSLDLGLEALSGRAGTKVTA